ncbi:MAG: DUF393 domain-containing protein [Acidobacteriota bacterium]|nr:MAG: DUF393 domain-containing protein [Acidobacteriota bacterium]
MVRLVLRRDRRGLFRFAALQSEPRQQFLRQFELPSPVPETIVLIEAERCFTHSSAALRVCRRLSGLWPLLSLLLVVPKSVRDAAYRAFARRRYRWFGKQSRCAVPPPETRGRFLE